MWLSFFSSMSVSIIVGPPGAVMAVQCLGFVSAEMRRHINLEIGVAPWDLNTYNTVRLDKLGDNDYQV